MRSKSLFYILLILATVGLAAAGDDPNLQVDDKDDGGGVGGPGCSSTTNPPCETEGDTMGGGGGAEPPEICIYSQDLGPDALTQYMDCLVSTLGESFEVGATVTGLDDVPTITVLDGAGNPPDTLCFVEASRDIQSTLLTLNGPRKNALLRKFTEAPAGDGQIIVTLNNWTIAYDTAVTWDRDRLNKAIAKRIGEHFYFKDEGGYWRIYSELPLGPVTRIGVKSTDSNIFRSGIAVLPFYMQVEGLPCGNE